MPKPKHQAQNQRKVNKFTPLIIYLFAPVMKDAAFSTFVGLTTFSLKLNLHIAEGPFQSRDDVFLSGV